MPILFIHGIAVRKERFDRLVSTVHDGFRGAGYPGTVTGCYWGDCLPVRGSLQLGCGMAPYDALQPADVGVHPLRRITAADLSRSSTLPCVGVPVVHRKSA